MANGGSGNTAVVAIVVLVILALLAIFYFLMGRPVGTGGTGVDRDINITPRIEMPDVNVTPNRSTNR